MNMRKILAVLLSLAMLCTLLPMSALTASAEEIPVLSMDWNDGTLGFGAGSVVAEGPDGSNCLYWECTSAWGSTSITVSPIENNGDYVATFKMKASGTQYVNLTIQDTKWYNNNYMGISVNPTTEWKEYSVPFNVGTFATNGNIYFKFQSSAAQNYWVDDLTITKVVADEPEGDETTYENVLEKDWNDGVVGFGSGSVVAEGPDGSNCFKWSASGGWSNTSMTVSPIEKNTNYIATFKMKTSAGAAMYLTYESASWGAYDQVSFNTTTEWADYEIAFNTGDVPNSNNAIFFKFQDQGTAQDIWVDDLVIAKVIEPEGGDDVVVNNLVKNGDFELGSTNSWSVHNGTTVTEAAAMNGSYGLHCLGTNWAGIASQTMTVTNGQAYKFSFWYYINKTDGTGFNYKLVGTSSGTKYDAYWPNTAGVWTKVEFEFLATDDSAVLFNLSGYNENSSPDFYIDDVMLTEVKTPSNDGYIVNGDFEVGTLTGWNTHQSTVVVDSSAAYEGDYGLKAEGNGGWGGLLDQSFTVKENTDYTLKYTIKCVQQGLNVQIKAADGSTNLYYKYHAVSSNPDWTKVEVTFNSGANTTAKFNLVGSGLNASSAASPTGLGDIVYFDNISIEKVGGEDPIPNTILTGGQNSISEDVTGLAFRFEVAASGTQIEETNAYVNGSAQVKLYKDRDDLYTLVKAGAVVTNNATIGKDAEAMILGSVDGKKSINIDAKYLCEVNDDSFAFAVRIVGIPEANLDTNIYARPYFVYEDADGNEIVEYGNTKSENYNHTANPKASIKILAIGNSFSQDAMNNHLYEVLESAGYEEIVLANMYIGGCSLDTHWSNMNNGTAAYTYYYRDANTSGWRTTYNQTLETAMNEQDWDYITIQQVSGSSGKSTDYGNLDNCLNWIDENKSNFNAKILWHMTWAYDEATSNSGFTYYNSDQMTMYRKILDTVNEKVASHALIDGIIPSGTSIQNMRTSSLVEPAALCETDGYHLSAQIGDYIAALTWYAYLSGDDVSGVAYQPDAVASYRDDINASVNAAVENPYKVTKCASYDTEKSIKVLSIGHSFSVDVMGTYLYQMLEQAGYEDITIGYLYYPGCQLSRHWEYISTNTNGHERYGKNETGSWVTTSNPYAIDVLRDEDWDYVTLQVSPDYVGGDIPSSGFGAGKVEYSYLPLMIDWIQENALNANVDIKFHQIWAYSEGCDLWSYTYHNYDQMTMYNNIIDATQEYVATNEDITGIIPCGTAVQNGRALLGDIFNMPDASTGGSDGYHLNEMYGDFLGSLTWACYFSGVDAHTITERSADMTEEQFSAIADAVNAALADWTQVTVG